MTDQITFNKIQEYYGSILKSSSDLKTSACCVAEKLPPNIASIVATIHEDVRSRFFGCGVIAPAEISGKTILDLGCGTGRDVYVLSKLVGEHGKIIGIDMTDEQLDIAKKHQSYHAKAFGYQKSNVEFIKGYIEDLECIAANSVDVVVSNCVINLSPAKQRVFNEIFRVLKPGGELHFSDVYCDRRLPKSCAEDQILLGECLGGALYYEDFRRMIALAGCPDARTLTQNPIMITDPDIQAKIGNAKFTSRTIRAFKLPLEDRCEDYGQVATYLGTIREAPHAYALDDHHLFEKNRPMLVCSNTAYMLSHTRFSKHFRVDGDLSCHFGLFPCGPTPSVQTESSGSCC